MAERREREKAAEGDQHSYPAVCAECKQDCTVPFRPDGTRPVYCKDCYASKRPQRRF